ncbi:MAG: SHOCT domain-containing protein [Methanobrevibacter sp.]|nr:SHOCT domain-containing protein [Methanobrevibacter sp.]
MVTSVEDVENIFEMSRDELLEYNQNKYLEFKNVYLNTNKSVEAIFEELNVNKGTPTYRYINSQLRRENLTRKNVGGRPKGVKNFNNLTTEEQEDLLKDYEEKYQQFLEYFEDLTLSVGDILKLMGTHHKSNIYKYIKKRLDEDGLSPTKRQGKVIGYKLRKLQGEKLVGYEEVYQEYKRLFMETDLNVKDIYEELNINENSAIAAYIRGRNKEEGLNPHKRRFQLHPPRREVTPEEQAKREELYQEFKRLFYETDKPLHQIYNQLGVTQGNSGRATYIKEKAKKEGLDGNVRKTNIRKNKSKSLAQMEAIYSEYKRLFYETDYKISHILEELEVKVNSPTHDYIRKHAKKDGLDGKKRSYNLKRQKRGEKKVSKKPRKYTVSRVSKYPPEVLKKVEDSMPTLKQIFIERNISEGTQKGYIAACHHWFDCHKNYDDLQSNVNDYMLEEDDRVPMRDRTIKKDLLNFREYLINCDSITTDKSFGSYFSKLGSIFRHFGLEIPHLPPVKMQKAYVSNFKELPTHNMIRTACNQSPLVLQAIILFMSSSGSAKAETLSLTVGMFLNGCADYLKQTPTNDNIKECIQELKDNHNIVPLIYLRRIKTDKYYYTCCSPEASYKIVEYLFTLTEVKMEDKLFDFSPSLLLTRFQEINDKNDWGKVGKYRRFRAHALRKFMASNIGLPRDQVDSFQGRSKDMIQEAYFKQDPKELKEIYLKAMHRVMIFNNYGFDLPDGSEINENSSSIKETITSSQNTIVKKEHQPQQPVINKHVVNSGSNVSISEELLNYAKLMDMGLITDEEFQQIKEQLLGGLLQ